MGPSFAWPLRVYWEDTDGGGVVYYANYLKYLERARSEWLRSIGIDQSALYRDERIQFVVVEAHVHYRKPARYDDLLYALAGIVSHKGASVTFDQEVRRDDPGGELLLSATIRAACLDADRLRPRALPPALRAELARG